MEKEELYLVIAKNISDLRRAKGMTQLDLAERIHYSDKTVSKWERAEAIPDMEEAAGSDCLLEQLNSAIGNGEFIDKIQYEPHELGDVLMLTGVGEVFPFMRIHTLLEALQPYFSDVPILVMYPGEFDGRHVKLFNRLTPNDYYRAFNVID